VLLWWNCNWCKLKHTQTCLYYQQVAWIPFSNTIKSFRKLHNHTMYTKWHTWMFHQSCFNNMLLSTTTSFQNCYWQWRLVPPFWPRNKTQNRITHLPKKEGSQNWILGQQNYRNCILGCWEMNIGWFSAKRGNHQYVQMLKKMWSVLHEKHLLKKMPSFNTRGEMTSSQPKKNYRLHLKTWDFHRYFQQWQYH
jgi:hypothetical protein